MNLSEYLMAEEDMRQQQDDDRLKMEGEVKTLLDRLKETRKIRETITEQFHHLDTIDKETMIQLRKALNYFIKLD